MDDDLDEEGTLDYGGVLPLPAPQPPGPALSPEGFGASPTGSLPAGPALPPTQPHTHLPGGAAPIPAAQPVLPPTQPHKHVSGLDHSLAPDDEHETVAGSQRTLIKPVAGGRDAEDDATTVRLSNRHLDSAGLDTHLARFLGKIGRLNVPTLQAALVHARSQRGRGVTLARALVTHGHLSQEEAVAFLRHVTSKALIEDSGEFEAPTVAKAPAGSSILLGDGWSIGDKVGDYQLLEKLGAGGMGVVYKAQDSKTGRYVAIKTLTPVEDPEFLARFRREGQAQSRLDHPNLVRVHSWGERQKRPYLVMDFVEGRDLQEILREGPLEPREAARITRDVASAVAQLHQTGVLHRDLKPSNILIDQSGRPRLVDFGVARLEGAETLTRTGDILGTPAFMSPEQALGEREAMGPKTDVYSLCAVLYNLLTGSPPFRGASAVTMLTKVVQDEPPPPRAIVEEVPEDLEAICLRGMSKAPEERYTATGLVEVLDRFLSGERLDPKQRGPAKARGGLILAFLLFIGGIGLGLWGRQSSPPTPSPSAQPSALPVATSTAKDSPTATPQRLIGHPLSFTSEADTFELRLLLDMNNTLFGIYHAKLVYDCRLTLGWRARQLAGGSWSVTAVVKRLRIKFDYESDRPNQGPRMQPLDFDSEEEEHQDQPFQAAVDRRFSLEIHPETGAVEHLDGVASIQSAIYARYQGPPEQRMLQRVPLFQPVPLQAVLRALLSQISARPTRTWTADLDLPQLFGARQGDWYARAAGLEPDAPYPAVPARFRWDTDHVLVWSGRAMDKIPPYDWTSKPVKGDPQDFRVSSTSSREVEGQARIKDGVPLKVSVRETYDLLRVFESKADGKQVLKGPNQTVYEFVLERLESPR